jgi:TP901 family phage tail tape measure protein
MPSTAGIKAGRAFVTIDAIDKTGAILNRVSGNFMKWGNKMEAMGQKLLSRITLAMIPSAFGLNFYKNFDDTLRKVEARSNGTAEEMQALRDQARRLGKDSAFSAQQVGQLQDKLAQLGLNRAEIGAATPDVLGLARAAGEGGPEDVQQAAEAVTGAIRGFKMGFDKTAEVASKMAVAANASNFTVQELATSMSYASTIANEFGVSFDETLSILSVWRNLNLDASTAGTAFRNILLEMSGRDGVGKFNEQLNEATGKTINFTERLKNLKSPSKVLFEIGEAMKNLGSSQKGELLNTLFGKRAVVPALALSKGQNPFNDILSQIQNAGNNTHLTTAATMDKGIGGSWRRFIHTLQDVAITIGEILEPALMDLSKLAVTSMNNFIEWAGANRSVIITVVEVTAAVTALGAGLMVAGVAFKLIAMLLTITAAGFTAVAVAVKLSSVGYLVHLGVLIVAKAAYLGFRAAVMAVNFVLAALPIAVNAISTAMTVGISVIKSFASGCYTVFKAIQAIADIADAALQAIALSLLVSTTVAYLSQGAAALVAAAGTSVLTAAMAALQVVGMGVLGVILAVVLALGGFYALLLVVGPVAAIAFGLVRGAIQGIGEGMKGLLPVAQGVFGYLIAQGQAVAATLFRIFQGVNAAMAMGDMNAAWEVAILGLQVAWLEAVNIMKGGWDEVSNAIFKTWHIVKMFIKDVATSLQILMAGFATVMPSTVQPIMLALGSISASVGTAIAEDIAAFSAAADAEIEERRKKQALDKENREARIRAGKRQLETEVEALEDGAKAKANEPRYTDNLSPDAMPRLGGAEPPEFGHDLMGVGTVGETKALKGLEHGQIETAKAAYENSQRDLKDGNNPLLEATKEILVKHDEANYLLEKIAENVGAV